MSFREGRGRPHRDYSSRSEEKSHHGRGNIPPSRHLWVGNLPHNLSESALAHHFLQFGELESIAFQPGRSYAFINYRNEEEAFTAVKELQGYVIGGNPLKIEFAKAEKSSIPPRDADHYERRDDPHPKARGSPFSQRDSRVRYSSPEPSHLNKSKMNDKDAEPSEVLWIGFPAQLKVDEFVLRKAFSPFGEIEKITAFPGRTYAFVRFRNVWGACRAKENLQGKLFGNPRVHICFARNESGTSNKDMNSPRSPRGGSFGRAGSYEHLRSDRSYSGRSEGHSSRSPPYIPNFDRGDPNVMGLARNNIWLGGNDVHEERRFMGQGSGPGLRGNMYDHQSSPSRNIRPHIREFSPENYPGRGPTYDDPWDLPEDVSFLHEAKKLKTNTYPPDNELPEYPFSDLEKSKHIHPRATPQSGVLDKNYDPRNSGYRPIPERSLNTPQSFAERGDHWNTQDDFQVGSIPLPPPDRRRLNPDLVEASPKEVWKWEGMIAKGGTSVCRARCFPVGRPPDIVLPEYLDCTARTSLDMLAKHYYQAASAWVVFFVPANDHDIPYYNEFLNYLGEKQRAAVIKVDDRTTLFLVPPSEFSEKILKVPGKLSISGVILRLDPSGPSYGSVTQNENSEALFTSFQSDSVYQKQISPSGPYQPTSPFTNYEKPEIAVASQEHDYMLRPAHGTNWTPHDLQNLNPITRNIASQASSNASIGHHYSRQMQEPTHSNYTPDYLSGNSKYPVQENPPIPSAATPNAGIPSEQLAQLASSFLGQQGQFGNISSGGEYKPPGNINQSGYPFRMTQNHGISESASLQLAQLQQQSADLAASQRDGAQVNQQFQNAGQDDAETDPEKRLQATLQLAAALLQQIQQGKGT